MRRRVTLGIAAAVAATAGIVLARRKPAAHDHVAYPPTDTLKPIADDVWIVDAGPIDARGFALPVRMTVVRLANGELLLHSPTRYSLDLARALGELGTVKHLVAPNVAHWMFVGEWQRVFRDAIGWGAPGLAERGQVRRSDVRIDRVLADDAPPEWAEEIDQGVVTGAGGFSEVWFFHRASRTLLLTDLVENLRPDKLTPATALLMRAAAATSGTTARYLRPLLRWRGGDVRAAVARMTALEPERVVFAHGDLFAEGGAERLRAAFAWLG